MPNDGFKMTDRLGLWWAAAGVLVLVAYAIPLFDILQHARFGSPGFKPLRRTKECGRSRPYPMTQSCNGRSNSI